MDSFRHHVSLMAFVLAMPLVLQGCAYQRPAEVTAQMARTESAIQQAEQAGAQEKSLSEYQGARDKFADAQEALAKKTKAGDRVAVSLAQQAQVDAQFAAAKAQSARQEEAAREVAEGVEALRDEASRPGSPTTSISSEGR